MKSKVRNDKSKNNPAVSLRLGVSNDKSKPAPNPRIAMNIVLGNLFLIPVQFIYSLFTSAFLYLFKELQHSLSNSFTGTVC